MYRLACGPLLVQAKNGDILCAWLSGGDTEPNIDNCVLLARSNDLGKSWSDPKVMIPPDSMASALSSITVADDGTMIALGAWWPSEMKYTKWYYFRMESFDNGLTWSEPEPITLREDGSIAIMPPKKDEDGYLIAAQFFDERPVPLRGAARDLVNVQTEEEAKKLPPQDGEPDKYHTHLHGCSLVFADDKMRKFTECGKIDNRPLGLLEPTAIRTKDGGIVMFMRAESGGFLWRAQSDDNGKTWTKAVQTDIKNPTSLSCVIRLADGRIALINNNSGGVVGSKAKRDPLTISVSSDELKSWDFHEDIISGGELAYPNAIILNDGRLVFAYDRDRREIRFVEVML